MLKTWFQTLLTSLGITAIGILTSIITARGLGPEGRGLLASALLLVSLAAGVSQFGYGQAYVYVRRVNPHWRWALHLSFASTICGTTVSILTYHALKLNTKLDSLEVASLYFLAIATTVGGIFLNAAQQETSLRTHNKAKIINSAILLTGLFTLFFTGHLDTQNALWTQLIATLAMAITALQWLAKDLAQTETHETVESPLLQLARFTKHALKLHLTVLSGLLLNNIDKIYLYLFGSLKDFGIYSIAYATSRMLGSIQEALSTTVYSKFAGKNATNSSAGIHQAFRITFTPMLFLAVLGGAIGPYAMEILFGKDFREAGIIFAILLVECVLGASSWLLAQQFNSAGRPGIVFARQAISAIPVFALLPFIPAASPLLAISAMLLISSLIRLIITLIMFRMDFNEPISKLLPTKEDMALVKFAIMRKQQK